MKQSKKVIGLMCWEIVWVITLYLMIIEEESLHQWGKHYVFCLDFVLDTEGGSNLQYLTSD